MVAEFRILTRGLVAAMLPAVLVPAEDRAVSGPMYEDIPTGLREPCRSDCHVEGNVILNEQVHHLMAVVTGNGYVIGTKEYFRSGRGCVEQMAYSLYSVRRRGEP